MVIRATTKPFFYDVDLHVVSALFRLREGVDRGVDVRFWCDQTGEFGVQVNEGPIARRSLTACRSGASGAEWLGIGRGFGNELGSM